MILKICVEIRSHANYKRRQNKVIVNNSEGTDGKSLKSYHSEKSPKEIKYDGLNPLPNNYLRL